MSTSAAATVDSSLCTLRVDATTDNGYTRIVDTLLFDPTCWPIPLQLPLHESVEKNVTELANSVISDAEVVGMGRTVRHFTNRVDLWSSKLQQTVEDQLRTQLWDIIEGRTGRTTTSTLKKISLRLTVNNVVINDDFNWDTSLSDQCPIAFAKQLSKELNLPDEATVAIACSIVEQLHGVPMNPGIASATTSAHELDSRDFVASLSHAVALHRPPVLDRKIN